MNKTQTKELIEDLFRNVDGYRISAEGQKALGYYFLGYEYGEALFDCFYDILSKTKPKKDEVFYDLGSGLGKKVIIAALGFPFQKSVGIEAISTLHTSAQTVLTDNRLTHHTQDLNTTIEFYNKDFLEMQIDDGDVFYISIAPHILFGYFQGELLTLLEQTKIGTRVITSNVPVPSDRFKIEDQLKSYYTSGEGVMYLHRKIS